LVERGLRLEQYQGRLVEYETRWRSELEPAQTRYMEIVTQARGMTPDDPNYQALLEGEAALRAEIEGMNQEAQAELQTIQSEVFAEVYRLLQEGVEVKRAELGYDVVLASRSNDRDIVAPNLQAFTQELLFRPVIASNGDDITDAVAEMLSLPEPVDPTAVAPAGPEAPAADADGEVDEDGFTPVGDGEG
ncbi:MAG: OmpH family outer membrane protein, partial [Planctomycetota bacterium]